VVRALDGVSLELASGEALGIVGESGCGKSTLARCAVQLLRPTSGRVWFDGVDMSTLAPGELRRRRREFQIIFQDPFGALDPRMTVRRILLEPFEAHALGTPNEREQKIRALLVEVGLEPGIEQRFPADLSGGEQQRIAIARALALEPRMIIADEPVSALDVSVQAQILNLLDGVRYRFGLALILISHDLLVVRYACSRIAVMYMGRIVEERRTEELFAEPLHPYTRLLLDSMPSRHVRTTSKDEPAGVQVRPGPHSCAFYSRCAQRMTGCASSSPALVSRGDGTRVACFLYT
jgi:oligopeptide transport system ATP-binding protein